MSISPNVEKLNYVFYFEGSEDTADQFQMLEHSYFFDFLDPIKKHEVYNRLRAIADKNPSFREQFEELKPPEDSPMAKFNHLYQKILDQVECTESFRNNLKELELFADQNPYYKGQISCLTDPIEVQFLALKDRFKKIEGYTEAAKVAYFALISFVETHSQFTQRLSGIDSPNQRYFSSKIRDYENHWVSPSRIKNPDRWYAFQKKAYDDLKEWIETHPEFKEEFLKLKIPVNEKNTQVSTPTSEELMILRVMLAAVKKG